MKTKYFANVSENLCENLSNVSSIDVVTYTKNVYSNIKY